MSRAKKLYIIIPLVILLFLVAYANHKYADRKLTIRGRLQDKEMREISGMAASSINKDVYYVENDSGDTSRFFAISPYGQLLATIYYSGDRKGHLGVYDCEDIAVGPGPVTGKSYIYVGDIGDNYSTRKYISIYRIEERKPFRKDTILHADAALVHLKYPDGPKDAETLMVDPIQKLLYIVAKRGDSVGVYTSPLKYKANDTLMLTNRGKLFFSGIKPFKWITAGDISKDGRHILLKSYEKIYCWKRNGNEPVWKTLQRDPRELPYEQEKQGEAIAFTPDGKGCLTTSEGVFSPIYYYKVPEK